MAQTASTSSIPWQDRLRVFCTRLGHNVKGAQGTEQEHWHGAGREFLARTSCSALSEALQAGDWEAARQISAEFHRRRGAESQVEVALSATDAEAEQARYWALMHPWLKKDPSMVAGREPIEIRAREIEYDEGFVEAWPFLATETVATQRKGALRNERRADTWRDRLSGLGALDFEHRSARSAWRAARAAIAAEPDTESPLEVIVKVSGEAFVEMIKAHHGESGFGQVVGGVVSDRPKPYAVAVLHRRVDGRRIRFMIATDVEAHSSTKGSARFARGAAADFMRSKGLEDHFDADNALGVVLHERTIVHSSQRDPTLGESLTADQAYGSARCRHVHASWDRSGAIARLSCDDCFNGAVAKVPAHLLPSSHPLHQDLGSNPRYGEELRFWDAVHRRPYRYSWDRSDTASVNPADYALGAGPRPSARRAMSVSEAMNRR